MGNNIGNPRSRKASYDEIFDYVARREKVVFQVGKGMQIYEFQFKKGMFLVEVFTVTGRYSAPKLETSFTDDKENALAFLIELGQPSYRRYTRSKYYPKNR